MKNLDSYYTVSNKRPRRNQLPLKESREVVKSSRLLVYLKSFDVPLISATTACPCDAISLRPDYPCTIGRNSSLCEYVFKDRRVSKRHCQIIYDSVRRKIFVSDGGGGSYSPFTASGCFVTDDSRSALFQFHNFNNNNEVDVEGGKTDGIMEEPSSRFSDSLNGVFVNGIRIRIGMVAELSTGDEVLFVCCRNEGHCSLGIQIGFVIEKINVLMEESADLNGYTSLPNIPRSIEISPFAAGHFERKPSKCDEYIRRGNFLLSQCRHILHSDEPIDYLQRFDISVGFLEERHACNSSSRENQLPSMPSNVVTCRVGGGAEVKNSSPISLQGLLTHENSHTDSESSMPNIIQLSKMILHKETIVAPKVNPAALQVDVHGDASCQILNAGVQFEISLASDGLKGLPLNSVLKENAPLPNAVVKNTSSCISLSPPGKKFYLNSLKSVDHRSLAQHPVISLRELVYPVESLSGIFIATLTSDILWFISYCEIPSHLPVTIASHNTERCWSSSPEKRCSVPYSDFPNLVVVNPPFPEAVAFGNDRKKQGIACHHPKLFVLLREDQIRVVITSANLVEKQWNSITNTVWWQDFPRASSPDHLSLFSYFSVGQMEQDLRSDFAAQLAGFMASLVIDVPSQAHWILKLAKYNFKGAVGHLVASIPGIHLYRTPRVSEYMHLIHARSFVVNFLGSVEASVVGLSNLFHTSADSNGGHLRKLASFLGKCCQNAYGMSEVVLRRNTHITADVNAVSVLVPNTDEFLEGDCIQLGFLPRNIAKWVSPLWDGGFFRFSGHICPREALSAALGENDKKIQLTLYVSQGPNFSDISKVMQSEHVSALCSLIASVQRCAGLWRLEEVLGRYKWPELLETDFFYGASSIGAVNAQFMAAFSAAVGKRSFQFSDSQESDPEWGCWNTSQESRSPSIKIIFPTINRVQHASCGILPSKRILCFAERTWLRLRATDILHDAIPHPYDRIGHPLHVKVAQRRFQSKKDATPFGWVYCGSHNFSAAAWGRPIVSSGGLKHTETHRSNSSKVLKLHICNYELGIIFVFPPPEANVGANHEHTNMDDIVFPFVVPAPKYGPGDKPATAHALRETFAKLNEREREKILEAAAANGDMEEEIINEEDEVVEATDCAVEEKEEEKAYAKILWSQVDSSQSS